MAGRRIPGVELEVEHGEESAWWHRAWWRPRSCFLRTGIVTPLVIKPTGKKLFRVTPLVWGTLLPSASRRRGRLVIYYPHAIA